MRAASALEGIGGVAGPGSRLPPIDQQVSDKWRASMKDAKMHAQLVKLLGRVSIFAKTTEVFRNQLIQAMLPVEYSIGQVVFRENEPGNWMGIVLHGRLERFIHSVGAAGDTKLGEVSAGGMVGDIGVLGLSASRSVTVTAVTDASVLVLSRQSLEQAVAAVGGPEHFPLHEDAQAMQSLMMDTDAICNLACFKRLDRDFVLALCEHLEPRLCYPNGVLMRENNYGNEMYILQAGSVKVEKGGKFLVKLNGGVVLGELAVLGADKRRTATVTCTSLSLVYVLHGDVFHEILEGFPRSKKIFDHAYIARLVTFELTKVQEEVGELDRFYGRAHPMKQDDLLKTVYGINPNSTDIQLKSFKKQGTRLPKVHGAGAQPGIGKITSQSKANLGQHWLGTEQQKNTRAPLPGESGFESRSTSKADAPPDVKSGKTPSGSASLKTSLPLPLTARSDASASGGMTSERRSSEGKTRPTLSWDDASIRSP